MIEAFGAVLPVAVAVALSPFPIIAVVLVLLSQTGRPAAAAFLAGRLLGVAVVVGTVAAVSDLLERSAEASSAASVVRILVGFALIVLGLSKWRGRPLSGEDASLPGWMASIEDSTPATAARLAVLLSVANPKELLLGVGAGITIGSAGLPLASTITVAAAYTLIAATSVLVPVVSAFVARDGLRARLEDLRQFLVRHNAAIMSVLLLVIGAALIGGGLSGL